MGVKGLWEMVSPTGEMVCLAGFAGQAVAVDLAGWLVDTQALQLGHSVTRPHFRNLFFRTVACLQAGVLPVMVLEGDAPSLKWNTISSRNQRNFGRGGGVSSTTTTKNTGKRASFNALLKKCTELFDLLGVPWVRATGEAEATCAALNYHQVVQGVITQDSDVFLYGGNTVFRNFTASQKKVTAEKFRMDIIEERLQMTRGGMMLLAIVLGCDYLPGGVHGIGKDTVLRFLRVAYNAGDQDPTQRLKLWAVEDYPTTTCSELASTKWKKGSDDVLEEGLKKRIVATEGFPFTELLAEFKHKLSKPLKKIKWAQPDFEGLVRWCGRMLEWETSYVVQKVMPVVTRWTVTQGTIPKPIQPVSVVKRCVKQGVVCLRVQWRVSASSSLPLDSPELLTTEEPLELLRSSLPDVVQQFEDHILASKKGKKKTKTKETLNNKENIHKYSQTITEYFKPVMSSSTSVSKTTTTTVSPSILDSKVKDKRKEEHELRIAQDHKSTRKHTNKVLHREDQHRREDEEEEEEDLERDERELSLIIDRFMNMNMNLGKQQQSIAHSEKQRRKGNKYESKERSPLVQDLSLTNICQHSKMKDTNCMGDICEEKMPSSQQSLFDRASKRLSKKSSKHSEPLSYARTELDIASNGDDDNWSTSLVGNPPNTSLHESTIEIGEQSNREVQKFHKTHTEILWSLEMELKPKPECHDVSRDMFEDTLTEETNEVMCEDALGEDTLALMFEDSSLSDLNISQALQENEMTRCSPSFSSRCLSPQVCDLNQSSVLTDSPVHESGLLHPVCQSQPSELHNNYVKVENGDFRRIFPEENTKIKFPTNTVGFESIYTEKQTNKHFVSIISSPMVRASVEGESLCSLESPRCVGDPVTSHATELQYSTYEHSTNRETKRATTPLENVPSYNEDVFNQSINNYETYTAASSYNKTAIVEDTSAKATCVSSPQRSTETNLYGSKEDYNIVQFNLNNRKEENMNEKENLSVRHKNENHLRPQSVIDGQVWACDSFSPVEVTLTLAQRLKLKCSDKQFRKLLDDLR